MPDTQEIAVRPHGQPWPGLKIGTGRILRIGGELADCVNADLYVDDTLAKRRGIVRGFDEWFETPICGLFSYDDFCQNQHLLVATATGIFVRQPFSLPAFTVTDCYPFDAFEAGPAPNEDDWKFAGPSLLEQAGRLGIPASATALDLTPDFEEILAQHSLAWFKEACKSSYEAELTVALPDVTGFVPRAWAVLRATAREFSSAGAFLAGEVNRSSGQTFARLLHVRGTRVVTEIATLGPFADGDGRLLTTFRAADQTLDGNPATVALRFTPDVGAAAEVKVTIAPLDVDELGLGTGLVVWFSGPPGAPRPAELAPEFFGIATVDTGSV